MPAIWPGSSGWFRFRNRTVDIKQGASSRGRESRRASDAEASDLGASPRDHAIPKGQRRLMALAGGVMSTTYGDSASVMASQRLSGEAARQSLSTARRTGRSSP